LLVGFTDCSWANNLDDPKYIVGYVFSLGSGPITWAYKTQQTLYPSSVEAGNREKIKQVKKSYGLNISFQSLDSSSIS
jgi:hypothetical protein